jgi:hypothetical protein
MKLTLFSNFGPAAAATGFAATASMQAQGLSGQL